MDRRRFLTYLGQGSTAAAAAGCLGATPRPAPAVADPRAADVRAIAERLLAVDRSDLAAEVKTWRRSGAEVRDLLGAALLAGVRAVNPSPIGGQVHAMMMVPSAAAASRRLPADDALLPALFNLDRVKHSQARDQAAARGDWTMAAAPAYEAVPVAERVAAFDAAMTAWDEAAADRAVTALHPVTSLPEFFELLWPHAARDFRIIGHKIIYATQTYRALADLGWRHGLDPVRSVVLGVLDQNPYGRFDDEQSRAILAVHAANTARVAATSPGWQGGDSDPAASFALHRDLCDADADAAARAVFDAGTAASTLWDGVRLRAFELALQHPDIAGMHPVTSVNALHQAARSSASPATQRLMLLQAASWMVLFRDFLAGRGTDATRARRLADWGTGDGRATADPFAGDDREAAARDAARLLRAEAGTERFAARAVTVLARKAHHDHDYKFTIAALEEIEAAHPAVRPALAAASMALLRTDADGDGPAVALAGGA